MEVSLLIFTVLMVRSQIAQVWWLVKNINMFKSPCDLAFLLRVLMTNRFDP